MPYKKTGDAGNGGGSAPTNTDDFFFNKVLPFLTDNGFVANRAPTPGTAPDREIWTHKGSVGTPDTPYLYLRTRDDGCYCMTGLGINLAQEIFDQPDNPANGPSTTAWPSAGSGGLSTNVACPLFKGQSTAFVGHHLFTNAAGDYVHGVAQLGAREWRHFHFGRMPAANKYGTWVGGTYMFADFWNKAVGAVTDPIGGGGVNNHHGIIGFTGGNSSERYHRNGFFNCDGLVSGVRWFGKQFASDTVISNGLGKTVGDVNNSNYQMGTFYVLGTPGSWSGTLGAKLQASLIARTVPLIPLTIVARSVFAANQGFAVLGTIPDVFAVSMKDFDAGETLTIGSDSYVVFPVTNNDTVNTVVGDPYSGYHGLAYKIIP